MTENTIATLLEHVVETGRVPDHVDVRGAITRFGSVRERREIEQKVRVAAKRIVNALDSNLPAQAAQHAADVAEALAAHTAAGAAESGDEQWQRGWTRQHSPDGPPTRSKATEPLRALLRGATRGEVRARDLDALSLREGMSADERAQWRQDVLSEARNVQRVYRAGDQAAARGLADRAAAQLGVDMTEPEVEDPAEGISDPRELAALLPRAGR